MVINGVVPLVLVTGEERGSEHNQEEIFFQSNLWIHLTVRLVPGESPLQYEGIILLTANSWSCTCSMH